MTPTDNPAEIRAAGGVVWSRGDDGAPKILLVHRPRYDDWSLPKGKALAGETDLDCALREVEEETGLRCTPGEELSPTLYQDRFGRPKRVRYWAMEPRAGRFAPQDEVDEVRWEYPGDAAGILTYPRDAEVVASFVALGGTSPRRRQS